MQVHYGFCVMLLAFCSWMVTPTIAQQIETLPDASAVLEAFYAALGGEMAIAGMDEAVFRGTYEGEPPGTVEFRYKDRRFRHDFDFRGHGVVTQGFNGSRVWQLSPEGRLHRLSGQEASMAFQLAINGPQFLAWREFRGIIEVVEPTSFRGIDVWHLRFTDDNDFVVARYFKRADGLLVAAHAETEMMDSTTLYEFGEHDGVVRVSVMTTEMKVEYAPEEVFRTVIEFTEVDFDTQVDDSDFFPPHSGADR